MNWEEWANSRRKLIEDHILDYLPQDVPKPLREAMEYALTSGGKRLRPLLVLASAETFEPEEPEKFLPAACAVEYVHTYSLIHDDLPALDNDPVRRGKPSLHVAFGEDIAILAGDALLTLAFEALTKERGREIPGDRIVRAISVLAEKAGAPGMVGGQVADLRGPSDTKEDVEWIHEKKTAELIAASALIGAELAGAGEGEKRRIESFAKNFGLAFQIWDDINDYGVKNEKANIRRFVSEKEAINLAREKLEAAEKALKTWQKSPLRGFIGVLRRMLRVS